MNITVNRKVIEQALEALVAAYQGKDKTNQVTESITALRTALEQQYMTNAAGELEPVTIVQTGVGIGESEQAPVAYIHETGFLVRNPGTTLTAGTKLYAAPRCEWVGLTDEEYTELWGMKPDLLNFFRKIEAKLKEKNT